jgi:hypothetical protein
MSFLPSKDAKKQINPDAIGQARFRAAGISGTIYRKVLVEFPGINVQAILNGNNKPPLADLRPEPASC